MNDEEYKDNSQNDFHTNSLNNYSGEYDEVLSTGTFLAIFILVGLISLIPTIGPIIVLIGLIYLSVSKEVNRNLRNFARANLIMGVIALIIFLILIGTR